MSRSVTRLHLLSAAAAGLGALFVAAQVSTEVPSVEVELAAPRPAPAPLPNDRKDLARDVQARPALTLGDRPRAIPSSDGDAFAAVDWQPPPPPPPPAPAAPSLPPPPPVAPALPFAFV